jgi:hypothetical protein
MGGLLIDLEATPGIEPGIKALQASALPLGHVAECGTKGAVLSKKVGRLGHDPRPTDQPSVEIMERTKGFEPSTPTLAR